MKNGGYHVLVVVVELPMNSEVSSVGFDDADMDEVGHG
jgi:hypothetical protein